jgi:hypothetical protein
LAWAGDALSNWNDVVAKVLFWEVRNSQSETRKTQIFFEHLFGGQNNNEGDASFDFRGLCNLAEHTPLGCHCVLRLSVGRTSLWRYERAHFSWKRALDQHKFSDGIELFGDPFMPLHLDI